MRKNMTVAVAVVFLVSLVLATAGCNKQPINPYDKAQIVVGVPENGGYGKVNIDLVVPKAGGKHFVDKLCLNTTIYDQSGRAWTDQPLNIKDDSQIDSLGVCSDNTSWNPMDVAVLQNWQQFREDDLGVSRISAYVPINGHFRGNIFAVWVSDLPTGESCWQVAFLDLSQWEGTFGHDNSIIRPDGHGDQVIEFWTTDTNGGGNGGEGEGEGEGKPVVDGVVSALTNGIAHVGDRVELTVNVVSGATPMTYQWEDNDKDIANNTYNDNSANNQTLVIVSAGEINTGWYACIVQNKYGKVKSAAYHLTVLPNGGEGEGEGEGQGEGEFSLSTAVQGNGTVSPSGGHYHSGATVNLSAVPASGWRFAYWQGDLAGTQNPAPLVMNGNKSVTAVFEQNTTGKFVLTTLIKDGEGEVYASVVGPEYNPGTVVQLTAAPDSGYEFDHWEGDLSGGTNPASITMDANKNVTAVLRHVASNDAPSIPLEGQPNSLVRAIGERAEFTIIVIGAYPLTYQWFCNGLPIDDNQFNGNSAHLTTLVILSVSDVNYAGYYCIVTNVNGSVTSAVATLHRPSDEGNAVMEVTYNGTTASISLATGTGNLSSLFLNGFDASVLANCDKLRAYNWCEWHGGKAADSGWVEITWSQLQSLDNQTGKWSIVDASKSAKSEWVIIDELAKPAGGWTFPLSVTLTNWLADTNNPTKRVRMNCAFVSGTTEHYANTGNWILKANGTVIAPISSCLDYMFNP